MLSVTALLEEGARRARATYISPGVSAICRDYVEEQLKYLGGEKDEVIVEDLVEFLLDQAVTERGQRGGPQVRLAPGHGLAVATASK